MEEVKLNEYCNYSETQGVILCKGCGEQLWVNYPVVGDTKECLDCGCVMEFVE